MILHKTTWSFMLCWHLGAALKTVAHSRHLLCTAVSLRDDFRAYLPELLPRFIGLFAEAERSGNYDQVPVPAHSPSSPSPVPSRCFVLASVWSQIARSLLACFKQFVYKLGDNVPESAQCGWHGLKLWVCGHQCMLLCLLGSIN